MTTPSSSTAPTTTPSTTTSTTTSTHDLTVDGLGAVPVTTTERGQGRTYLLLHGGAGPQSVAAFADLLATSRDVRVITPVHPGFAGTPRPQALDSVRGLAAVYAALLDELDLYEVTVIGNSIGGWITAELALLAPQRLHEVVLVDAVGLDVPEHPVVDFFSLDLDQVADLSYHSPDDFRIDPSTMPPAQRAAMAGNRAALAVYGGTSMTDPTLADRLPATTVPTLVLWGEADRIVDPEVGRAYAAAVPGARFHLLPATGHVPQLETPDQLLQAITPR
ncbi:pimeloyl-ACP methyl ester carboxylesterase [Kineococcus radiotolerans]|uniref:Pimeloyl-ACP methyl ester carboxylesterase n=1 Tax=Kineococcus radiotolerans TaxID=131568 RepID=A0A7W4TR38_KINRA|nr:alpha/beta hydrolase [Kineococcus radiotolerans]MBB2903554.1 pimeloyl-ACP methyl ester carboxylesterase [Kineococcus radiotolerans]